MCERSRIICVFLILLQLFAGIKVYSQNLIDESFDNEPLPSVLNMLSEKYHLKFSYDYSLLEKVSVSGDFHNLSHNDFIMRLTNKYKFDFEKIDGVYLIKPQKGRRRLIVNGIILDGKSKERLPFANIYEKHSKYITASNQDGYFTLFATNSDTTKLVVCYMGYKTKELIITPSDTLEIINISLESEDKIISKVDVNTTSVKTVNLGKTAGHFTINPAKMADLPSLGELDIFRNLQLFPGISGTKNSSSGLIIRNSPPDQTLVNFDGFTILDLDHFFGMFSAVNSKVVKDIQVYKGGFEAKYGNRISSVVEITGKSGDLSKPAVHFNLNMISANLVLEFPLFKKASLLIAARRSYNDILKTPLYSQLFNEIKSPIDENYWLVNGTVRYMPYSLEPTFNFYDINVKLKLPLSKKDVLDISYFQSQDNLNLGDSAYATGVYSKMAENLAWGNKGLGLKWSRNWSKTVYSNFIASISSYSNDYDNYYIFEKNQIADTTSLFEANYIDNINLKFNTSWYINRKNTMDFGFDNNITNIDYYSSWDNFDIQDINQFANQLSLFVQNTHEFSPKMKLILGLRSNFISSGGKVNIEPRISYLYNFVPDITFKASLGQYHQYLNKIPMKDLDGINRDFWILSDNKIAPPVASNHITLGLTYKKPSFTIDVEAYYKDANNLIEYEGPYLNSFNYQFSDLEGVYHRGKGKIAGVDVLLLKNIGKYSGWIGYSFGRSARYFPTLNNGNPYPSNNDQRHELKIVNMLKIRNWNFALTWIYGSGKPYTQPEGQYYVKLLNGEQKLISIPESKNSSRLPAFHSLDMSVNYNFRIGPGFGKVGLSVFNIYGRENIKYRFYRIANKGDTQVSNQPVYKVYDIKLMGFTPNIFISFDF